MRGSTHPNVNFTTHDWRNFTVCYVSLQRTPGGYAITGQDSDFFIMGGIRYIPLQYLKIEGVGAQTQVTGRVFTCESVAAALRIPRARLHELAWLVGNDASADLIENHDVPKRLGIPTVTTKTKGTRCLPRDVAAFLARLPDGTAFLPLTLIIDHCCRADVATIVFCGGDVSRGSASVALSLDRQFYKGRHVSIENKFGEVCSVLLWLSVLLVDVHSNPLR